MGYYGERFVTTDIFQHHSSNFSLTLKNVFYPVVDYTVFHGNIKPEGRPRFFIPRTLRSENLSSKAVDPVGFFG